MPKTRDVTRVHHKTVSQHKGSGRAKRKPRSSGVKVEPAHVTVDLVDPRVWELALELAGGDHRRLKVESMTCVVVLNNPRGGR